MPGTRLLSATLVAALALATLTGCGEDSGKKSDKPTKAALACRAKWKHIGEDIAPQVDLTQPSALPARWNTVAATVDYYTTSAAGKGCGDQIDEQQQAITALKAWSAQLTGYDMEAQLALVKDDATAYAAGPWPAAPPTVKKKHKKKQPKPVRPPKPALVAAALKTLTTQAPVATQQQSAGWEQASVIDLGNTAATTKAKKDLAFLSSESSGWRACQAALATIRAALAAKTG